MTDDRADRQVPPRPGSLREESDLLVATILAGWGPASSGRRSADSPRAGESEGPTRDRGAGGPGGVEAQDGEPAPAAADPAEDGAHDEGGADLPPPLGCDCGICPSPTTCRACPLCRGVAGWDALAPQTLTSLADAADLLAGGLRAVAARLTKAAQQAGPTDGPHDERNTP